MNAAGPVRLESARRTASSCEPAETGPRADRKRGSMTVRIGVVFALAGITGFTSPIQARRAETTRTVYISATDSKGSPVTDLTASDLVVKEDGKERVIASLQ